MDLHPGILPSSKIYDIKHTFSVNFRKCPQQSNDTYAARKIIGDTIQVGESPSVTFHLEFSDGAVPNSSNSIKGFISSKDENVVFLSGQICCYESNGKLSIHKSFKNAQRFKAPNHEQLASNVLNIYITPCRSAGNQTLNFIFMASVLINTKNTKEKHLEKLYEKLNAEPSFTCGTTSLFDLEKKPDVLIQVGNKKYQVHKEILVRGSKIFEAMFNSDTKESQENIIVIEDMDQNIVEEMLCFIYTDTSPKINILADQLFPVADKYFLDKLKLMCEIELTKQTNIDNACEMASISSIYNSENLVAFVTDYIVDNYDLIVESNGWEGIQSIPKKMFADVMKVVVKR